MPVAYHLSRKEDISIESLGGHYHGVSTYPCPFIDEREISNPKHQILNKRKEEIQFFSSND